MMGGVGMASHRPQLCFARRTGAKSPLSCIKVFSQTDFTDDLKKFDVPTLNNPEGTKTRSFPSPIPPGCPAS
jgi:hypothetical protein